MVVALSANVSSHTVCGTHC